MEYVERADGSMADDPNLIAETYAQYLKTPFSRDNMRTKRPSNQDRMNHVLSYTTPTLTKQQRDLIDAPVSIEESMKVIKKLPVYKEAGPNDLRAELFKATSNSWASIVASIMNSMRQNSDPNPRSLTNSVIVLLYKKGDQRKVENYMQIALVNVLSMIFSTDYCNRIRLVLPDIISALPTIFSRGA